MFVIFLATLLTVEKLASEKDTLSRPLDSGKQSSSKILSSPLFSAAESESVAAVQPNGAVEHIMLTKSQYEELKAGGTIKLGKNVRLRAKTAPA